VIEDVPRGEQRQPLAEVDILASLTPEEIERLALLSASVHLGAWETLALDEERRALLLLASGRVRVHEPSAARPGLTISMIEVPTVVTQTGFAARPSRTVVVEALEPSVLRVLEWEVFEDVMRHNPEVAVKSIRLWGERLSTCEQRLSDLVRKEVAARLATLVLGLSDHHGVVTAEGDRIILNRYTHEQLASMVGANREAVTRGFGKLRKAGALEIRDRQIYVTDVDALGRLAETQR
jgi:CRP/FNR family transcriptional regulator, cyclic AMP receptor protein